MKTSFSTSALLIALLSLLVEASTWARPLQIIHTNDLHSHLEKGDSDHTGGYAAVKGVIESLKARAAEQGIETLVVDAGDFSEGNAFFFADHGRESWRLIDAMGYDAVTLGNHDWLIGTRQMDEIIASIRPRTPLLGANVEVWQSVPALREHLRPAIETTRAGARIAIVGLTTDELIYSWRVDKGRITPPIEKARELVPALRDRNDFVIALSHLGYKKDRKLAYQVPGIDLIIGGHSHTALTRPAIQKNYEGRKVPIVQTGSHGEFVGDLVVDVVKGKPLKVLSYRLVPVFRDGPRDPEMETRVSGARHSLEQRYGTDWLYETIGHSEVPIERPLHGPTRWGQLSAETLHETAGTDLSLDIGEFYGVSQPAGPVTRETLMQFYPRVFDIHRSSGWTIWRVQAPGWLLRLVLTEAVKMRQYIITAGLTYQIKTNDQGEPRVSKIRVNGRKLVDTQQYSVAVSEGLGRGGQELSALLRLIFEPEDTGVPFWSALERKIRAEGGVIRERAPASLP
ncbi:MAG: bifunctional metallophosphatase/5'-nucleotidase [Oligoflexia bacterium]|nr:bifunctional metallophosphatase/5'-nucleotidase [Oligoflexia bacterium]